MQHTFIAVLLGFGALQGVFITVILLFFKKGNVKANVALTLLVFSITGIIFQNFIVFSDLYKDAPHLTLVFYPMNKLIGPSFYFFVIFLINPNRSFKYYDLFHLVPFLYKLYEHLPFYALSSAEKIGFIDYFFFTSRVIPLEALTSVLIAKGHTLVYLVVSIAFLRRYEVNFMDHSSNTLIGFIGWLKRFTSVFAFFVVLAMAGSTILFLKGLNIYSLEAYIHIVNTVFIHFIAIAAIQQPEKLFFVFADVGMKSNGEKQKTLQNIPIEHLLQLMENGKPYLNPDLKIHNIATALEQPPYSVSQQINQQLGLNFYDFVNKYRVEEFKKRVDSEQYNNLTLLGIALDVGFNSKASFNRVFKKHTGMTPSEYLNKKRTMKYQA
jgi:AraC-like DNA-binding protein